MNGMRQMFTSARRRWVAGALISLVVIAPIWLAMMMSGAAAAGEDACVNAVPDRSIRFWPPAIMGDCPEGRKELFSAGQMIFETVFMLAFVLVMAAVVAALIARWVERRSLTDIVE